MSRPGRDHAHNRNRLQESRGGSKNAAGGAQSAATQASTPQSTTNVNATSKAGRAEAAEEERAVKASISQLALPAKIAPSTILARVQGKPLSFAQVAHLMAIDNSGAPLPDPPSYQACIAHLKKEPAKPAEIGRPSIPAGASEAQLEEHCKLTYEHDLQSALSSEIHSLWLLAEAAEEGVHVSDAEVRHELEQSKKQFGTEAQFKSYLKSSGQSLADVTEGLKLGKLVNGLVKRIKAKIRVPDAGEVAAYYHANLQKKYTIPEGRTVRIVRTTTQGAARHVKQELEAGKSFSSVVKSLSSIAQPLAAKNGEVADLTPNLYGEKNLNDAIFSAKLHKLYGPILVIAKHATVPSEGGSGSYVFEVTKVVPARAIPLAQVKASIAKELLKSRSEATIKSAVAAFKAKWRVKTDCTPGFVVKNCRQYKGTALAEQGDPFTL